MATLSKELLITSIELIDVDEGTNIPTAIRYTADGAPLIGHAARRDDVGLEVNEDFKIELGQQDPRRSIGKRQFVTATGERKSAGELAADFIHQVIGLIGCPMYSDWVILSLDVAVFRSDDGELLEQPWTMTILTSPAVNGAVLQRYAPERLVGVPQVMTRRTGKVLAVAAAHDVRRFILGAWGCGAFGLEPEMMVGIFRDALRGTYRGVFDEIVFAITDWSPDERFIGPFRRAFRDPITPRV